MRIIIILLIIFSVTVCYAGEVDTSKAVIHHTASHDVSAATIDKWHKENGWDGIGYHFVIRKNGDIENGRSISKKGAHAKGRNHYVGIALTGYENFTDEQIRSLKILLSRLKVQHIERHHLLCPGEGLDLESLEWENTDEQ